MQQATFTKNNQSFICLHCHANVDQHPTSSRDHCPDCLYSLHVDINPGDRANECRGLLQPLTIDTRHDRIRIHYRCETCKKEMANIVAPDDNPDLLIELSALSS